MKERERDREMETEREALYSIIRFYMDTVSLNEPISCHCVREFKAHLMDVGLCSSRYIKRTQSLPIKSPLYGVSPHS